MMNSIGMVLKKAGMPLLAAVMAMQGASVTMADDTVTLKVGSSLPAAHYVTEELIKKFIAGVEQNSGGEIKFELYPAAQLGKDTTALLKSGIVDVGLVIPGLYPEKYPLSSVAELPQISSSSCDGSSKAWALAQPDGALDKLEYKPAGIRALSAHLLSPYVVYTRGKKVEKLADISGLKLWVSGAAQQETVKELGGVPIRIPSPELYDAATRGTIDGALFPYSGLVQYELQPILNNAVSGVTFGAGLFFLGVTEKRWDGLSEKQRTLIAEEANKAQKSFCEWIDKNDVELRKQVAETKGYTIVDLTPEARDEFVAALNKIGDKWATDIDAKGKQGSAVLKAMRETTGQ